MAPNAWLFLSLCAIMWVKRWTQSMFYVREQREIFQIMWSKKSNFQMINQHDDDTPILNIL